MLNYCLLLPNDKKTPIKEASLIWKKHQGHFIGIGYVFPKESETSLEPLCKTLGLRLLRLPIAEEDFQSYVSSYKLDFLYRLRTEKMTELLAEKERPSLEHSSKIKELESSLEELSSSIERREKASQATSSVVSSSGFKDLLIPPQEEDISREIKNISPGVATGLSIGSMPLKLDGGEISVLAAPTGHGKTSFLINVLMGILQDDPASSVFLFSFEEARAPIFCLALNCYIGAHLSENNRESIRSYFRDGHSKYISEKSRPLFLEKKASFFKDLIEPGRLNIHYSSYSAEELSQAIRFLASQPKKPSAICIDYMQLLRLGTSNRLQSRQEELKQICLILKDCAVETGLPILIAAQFNRTVQSESDLSAQAIGEAGDIERIAGLILGCWNRRFSQQQPEDSLFVKVLKGRNAPIGASESLRFEGNECKITNLRSGGASRSQKTISF